MQYKKSNYRTIHIRYAYLLDMGQSCSRKSDYQVPSNDNFNNVPENVYLKTSSTQQHLNLQPGFQPKKINVTQNEPQYQTNNTKNVPGNVYLKTSNSQQHLNLQPESQLKKIDVTQNELKFQTNNTKNVPENVYLKTSSTPQHLNLQPESQLKKIDVTQNELKFQTNNTKNVPGNVYLKTSNAQQHLNLQPESQLKKINVTHNEPQYQTNNTKNVPENVYLKTSNSQQHLNLQPESQYKKIDVNQNEPKFQTNNTKNVPENVCLKTFNIQQLLNQQAVIINSEKVPEKLYQNMSHVINARSCLVCNNSKTNQNNTQKESKQTEIKTDDNILNNFLKKESEKVNLGMLIIYNVDRYHNVDKIAMTEEAVTAFIKVDEKKVVDASVVQEEVNQIQMLRIIRFIGELFKFSIISENMVHCCVIKLLKWKKVTNVENQLECLCKLFLIIGKDLDHPKAKFRMDQYFAVMNKIIDSHHMSTKIKFEIKNIIDLRNCNWIHKLDEPKTLDQMHNKAKIEQEKEQENELTVQEQKARPKEGNRSKQKNVKSDSLACDSGISLPSNSLKSVPFKQKFAAISADEDNFNYNSSHGSGGVGGEVNITFSKGFSSRNHQNEVQSNSSDVTSIESFHQRQTDYHKFLNEQIQPRSQIKKKKKGNDPTTLDKKHKERKKKEITVQHNMRPNEENKKKNRRKQKKEEGSNDGSLGSGGVGSSIGRDFSSKGFRRGVQSNSGDTTSIESFHQRQSNYHKSFPQRQSNYHDDINEQIQPRNHIRKTDLTWEAYQIYRSNHPGPLTEKSFQRWFHHGGVDDPNFIWRGKPSY